GDRRDVSVDGPELREWSLYWPVGFVHADVHIAEGARGRGAAAGEVLCAEGSPIVEAVRDCRPGNSADIARRDLLFLELQRESAHGRRTLATEFEAVRMERGSRGWDRSRHEGRTIPSQPRSAVLLLGRGKGHVPCAQEPGPVPNGLPVLSGLEDDP